jgi:hypothetical protein
MLGGIVLTETRWESDRSLHFLRARRKIDSVSAAF